MSGQSIKERLESYPFTTYMGVGAAIGLIVVAIAIALGRPDGTSASTRVAERGEKSSALADRSGAGGYGDGEREGDGAGDRAAGGGGGAAEEADPEGEYEGGGNDAERGDDGAGDDDADGNDGADDAAGDDDADGDDDAAADEAAEDPAADPAADPDPDPDAAADPDADPAAAADPAADAAAAGEDPVELDDAGEATPTPPLKDSNRAAEASMTADELYEAAKKAYEEGDYRDAFRLSTRSYYKERRPETQFLRGKAACALKDEEASKEIVKSFKLSDPKRKQLRDHCKAKGVRVGI
jgi:hypothetical protein